MARKTSDIAMLLGTRSRSRSGRSRGSSLLGSVLGVFDGLLGGAKRRQQRAPKAMMPTWLTGVCVLLAFAGGFVLGGRFGDGTATDPLRADGTQASFLANVDTLPKSGQAFLAAGFGSVTDLEEGQRLATELALELQHLGVQEANPFLFPTEQGSIWTTLVYYQGETEKVERERALRAVAPQVGEEFEYFHAQRKEQMKLHRQDPGANLRKWPFDLVVPIR